MQPQDMKELDPNTKLKNEIEEEKLQMQIFKLSRSGTIISRDYGRRGGA